MKIIRWQPPWPMIQISEREWVIIRDDRRRPAAIVRGFQFDQENWYRIVSWAPKSEDRHLFGWVRTLAMADMAVTFLSGEPYTGVNPLTVERSPEWAAFMRLVQAGKLRQLQHR